MEDERQARRKGRSCGWYLVIECTGEERGSTLGALCVHHCVDVRIQLGQWDGRSASLDSTD